jgi:hypothetical protein
MLDANAPDLIFKTEAQVEAYAKFFLATSTFDVSEEYPTIDEAREFEIRRERNLKAQLDHFKNVDFAKANIGKIDANYHKIVKASYKNPLGAEGATKQSSRFNYKDAPLFRNQTVYFGKNKLCCEFELFHMDYQREQIKKAFDDRSSYEDGELRFAKHIVKHYQITLDNVLILTSKPSWDAINISPSAFMNEWFDLNETYEIPSASQILGTIARVHKLNGILYKSVRYQTESNLVVFTENAGELKFKQIDSQDYNPSSEIIPSSESSIGMH